MDDNQREQFEKWIKLPGATGYLHDDGEMWLHVPDEAVAALSREERNEYNQFLLGPTMPPEMMPAAVAAEMRRISQEYAGDPEEAHSEADALLCRVLRQWGYGEAADVFEKLHKWYA